jgi:hypothetical protein
LRQQFPRPLATFSARFFQKGEQIGAKDIRPVAVRFGSGIALLSKKIDIKNAGKIEIMHSHAALTGVLLDGCSLFLARPSFRLHAL